MYLISLDDYFVVRITEDPVFGTPVFTTMVTSIHSLHKYTLNPNLFTNPFLSVVLSSYSKLQCFLKSQLCMYVRVVSLSVPVKLPLLGERVRSAL